jgi:Antirestriction protein
VGLLELPSVEFSVHTNGFEGSLSADAAGITVCLFAFSHLSFQQPSEDVFSRHFYALREFALDHQEAPGIFAAID